MATQGQSANAAMRPSQAAYDAVRRYEGVRYSYYNDSAGNCTSGIGTLAHFGLCTPEELRQAVTGDQVNGSLFAAIDNAAAAVRRAVTNQPLTQAQFDALVTYTYNRGATGAHPALHAANQGNNAAVVSIMLQNVYVHPHDRHGHRGHPRIDQGLVRRRHAESMPFSQQQPNRS